MKTFEIRKQFAFSASHILTGLPEGHPCGRMHGHNYIVEIVLAADDLNEVGFVRDYGELKVFKEFIDNEIDHRHLNDVIPGQPSAELIAKFLYEFARARWPEVVAVRVSETPKTWATYSPSLNRTD